MQVEHQTFFVNRRAEDFLPSCVEDAWKNLNSLRPIPQNGQTHSNNLPTNCLSVFDHFVKLVLKGLKSVYSMGWVIFVTQQMVFKHVITIICGAMVLLTLSLKRHAIRGSS